MEHINLLYRKAGPSVDWLALFLTKTNSYETQILQNRQDIIVYYFSYFIPIHLPPKYNAMKTVHKTLLLVVIAFAIVGSFFIDFFEELKKDWILFIIAMLCVTAATFSVLFCCIYYDVFTLLQECYYQLIIKLCW